MFGKIAAFELRYQLKSPVLWIVFLLFFLLTFFAVASDNVSIGGGGGNIHENSPFSIIQSTAVMAIFAQFVVVAFVANIILRDVETGFGPIIQSTRPQGREGASPARYGGSKNGFGQSSSPRIASGCEPSTSRMTAGENFLRLY